MHLGYKILLCSLAVIPTTAWVGFTHFKTQTKSEFKQYMARNVARLGDATEIQLCLSSAAASPARKNSSADAIFSSSSFMGPPRIAAMGPVFEKKIIAPPHETKVKLKAPVVQPSAPIISEKKMPAKSVPIEAATEMKKPVDPGIRQPQVAEIVPPPSQIFTTSDDILKYHPKGEFCEHTLYEYKFDRTEYDKLPGDVKDLLKPYAATAEDKEKANPGQEKQLIGVVDYGSQIGLVFNTKAAKFYLGLLPNLGKIPGLSEESKKTMQDFYDKFRAAPENYAFKMLVKPASAKPVQTPPVAPT